MFNRFNLSQRFLGTTAAYWLIFILAMLTGVLGLMQAKDILFRVHEERMKTVDVLNQMQDHHYKSRLNLIISFQHDPDSPLVVLHDHPLSDHINDVRANIQATAGAYASLKNRSMESQEGVLFEQLAKANAQWQKQVEDTLERLEKNDYSAASMQAAAVAGRTEGEQVLSALNKLIQYQSEHANQEYAQADQRYKNTLIFFALIVLLGALPVTWLMILNLRRMSQGFHSVETTAQAIAKGDLTQRIYLDGKDEVTQLLTQMQAMQQNLRQLISRINHSANEIYGVSNQVAQGSTLLAERTDQQAASLQETSSATEELTTTVQQNAANAREAEIMSGQAAAVARQGGDTVNNVISTMDEITEASNKISDIVNIIDSIAFQTNILALNAAVEAARAGEQRRGFAVVASEVRALAQRSASAAHEVKELIESSVNIVNNSSAHVSQAGQIMTEIVSNNERMMSLVQEISAASQEQSIGLNEINQAVSLMDEATHQNVTLVEQTTQASGILRNQSDQLLNYVSAFNIGHTVELETESYASDEAEQTARHAPQLNASRARITH
ncbi:Dipeptide chemoreceptor protein [Oligella ureolytica]|uniref:Dipeptide chemoreceptor protein n=1 Tax=Oligella ureolytica TaxID=90244 RepID=A0A378XIP0_9BURK|nr:methyl-accepting chemotaxis protein [Oligella ureolytica]QPT39718.1 MCP four helix bundle domain-containing protein [Oligella ureolytica]SUA57300.1 Dipeptide chemoreceptor protein [Oligella ureolytica]